MIGLEPSHLANIKTILRQYVPEHEVRAFGSRVHGENLKPHSDLDLVIMNEEPLKAARYALLQEAFSESDLPIKIDLVEWASISKDFRELISRHFEPFFP